MGARPGIADPAAAGTAGTAGPVDAHGPAGTVATAGPVAADNVDDVGHVGGRREAAAEDVTSTIATPAPVVRRPAWTSTPERGSMFMIRLMTWLSLNCGRRLTRPIVYGISAYFLVLAPNARHASRHYLRRILDREPSWRDLYLHIVAFATSIHDRLYLLNERFDLFDIDIHGEDLVMAAHGEGRGAFLMGAHVGSFELIHALGRRQPGVKGAMVMYEENARRINALMAAINPEAQQDILPLGRVDSMLMVRRALNEGVFVGVLGDRSFADDMTVPVTFLGRTAWLPSSAFRMAAVLKRSVIFMVGLWLGGNRYKVLFLPLADFSNTSREDREAAIADAMHRYAALLEQHCREAPYNWFNFFDFWQVPPGVGAANPVHGDPR